MLLNKGNCKTKTTIMLVTSATRGELHGGGGGVDALIVLASSSSVVVRLPTLVLEEQHGVLLGEGRPSVLPLQDGGEVRLNLILVILRPQLGRVSIAFHVPQCYLDGGERALPGLDGRRGGPADVDRVGEDGEEVGVLGIPPGGEPGVPRGPALDTLKLYHLPHCHPQKGSITVL